MGPDAMQREMLGQLDRMGLSGKTLLEIGCGVGVLHQTLLERGAASALGIDLAPKMLDHARERARARALGDKVEYRLGDFVEMETELDPADLTLLDKVVCCYPDAEGMLEAAARHTRVALALVYPRRHWLGLLSNRVWNAAYRVFGSDFRSYVHDPGAVHRWLERRGLRRVFSRDNLMWHTQVYALIEADQD
jgi:magnesium-protoporphyrin O-methyltransferase